MKVLIGTGDTVLDIGANIGFYTGLCAKLVGVPGHVHAFEIDLQTFGYLSEQFSHQRSVHLNNLAISNHNGTTTLFTSHRLNVDHKIYQPSEYAEAYDVDVTTIDSYVKNEYLVDFVKMDIQGAEILALEGMQTTIKQSKDIKIIMELLPSAYNYLSRDLEETFELISNLELLAYVIENHGLKELNKGLVSTFKQAGPDQHWNLLLRRK